MIRTFAIALALSVSFPAFTGPVAYAQTPDTDQTDRSEDDWRKSQKKKTGEDVLNDIFQNKSIFGQGSGGYEQNPIDALPERSRNHLKKERAKALATVDPNNVPDIPYTPSAEAQTDPKLAEQEKEVWEGMVKDMQNGGAAKSQRVKEKREARKKAGLDPYSIPGQNGSASGTEGVKEAGRESGANTPAGPTPVRGGSSSSVSDILNKIKGLKSGAGTLPRGIPDGSTAGSPNGQNPDGSAPSGSGDSGNAPDQGNADGARPSQGQGSGEAEQDPKQGETQASQDNAADAAAKAAADKAANDAAQSAQNQQAANTAPNVQPPASPLSTDPQQTRTADILGPLERMKRQREQETAGSQSSAYDFLKDASKSD